MDAITREAALAPATSQNGVEAEKAISRLMELTKNSLPGGKLSAEARFRNSKRHGKWKYYSKGWNSNSSEPNN
jgi:antitoxin component YwqK of YwqJK toxin-antitoxin module